MNHTLKVKYSPVISEIQFLRQFPNSSLVIPTEPFLAMVLLHVSRYYNSQTNKNKSICCQLFSAYLALQ